MNKEVKIMLIIFTIVLVILIGIFIFNFDNAEGKECDVDSDCVKVQTTCCSCSMGGEEKCVSKDRVEFYEKKLAEECDVEGGIICPAVYNCQDDLVCKCNNGKCE